MNYGAPLNGYFLQVGVLAIAGHQGDFNGDGIVDAADYTVWRDGLGATYTNSDYDIWKDHCSETASSRSLAIPNTPVPEPGSLTQLTIAAIGIGWSRRSHKRRGDV